MGLTARHLEANGIATVVLGSARDVTEHCGVPRFLFTDFPLGNSVGRPYDAAMQRAVVGEALDLLESAVGPRTTAPVRRRCGGGGGWREAYLQITEADREALLAEGEAGRRREREAEKASGRVR